MLLGWDACSLKILIIVLAMTNLTLYIVRAAIAGDMLNDNMNGETRGDTNSVTDILVQTTLILCMIGSASSILGALHYKAFNKISRSASFGVGMIAMNLNLLVLGYACKQWDLGCRASKGCTDDQLSWRAQVTGILACAQFFTHLLFVETIYTIRPEQELDALKDERQAVENSPMRDTPAMIASAPPGEIGVALDLPEGWNNSPRSDSWFNKGASPAAAAENEEPAEAEVEVAVEVAAAVGVEAETPSPKKNKKFRGAPA